MAVDVGSAVGYLDLDISGFLAGLNQANEEANKQSKGIGAALSGAGKTLTSVGTTLTKNVTVPLLGIGAAGLKVAMDFEKGMSEVKAISGATGTQFEALKNKAVELGGSTAFSANEVAAAMTEMAKAGWSSQQIIDGMGGVLNAAAASGEGLAAVSTIVADAITGFGLEAKESTKVADLLTQAANSGTIGIDDLGESFKYIAPVAGSMGLSIEDVTTALAAMSKSGIKGSQAGTSLRGVLTRMVKPTDQVADAMKDLGIVLTNQDGTFKSLDTIVGDMRGKFSGLTDKQKTYYAAVLAGQEGMSGLLSLLNLTQEEYDEIAESMDNAKGTAEETAKVMQDNLASKIEQLGGSLESLAIKLADLVLPYLQSFVVWLTSLVDKFAALDPETQKTILKFAGLVAAAGPVITIIGKITSVAGTLITSFGKVSAGFAAVKAGGTAGAGVLAKFGGALAGVTGPMVAVAAVIGVLAAAFTNLWKTNEDFRYNITSTWESIKATFQNFADGIVERLNSLGFSFTSIAEVLSAVWTGFCNLLAPIFQGAFDLIANGLSVVLDNILNIVDFFVAIFTGNWQGAWDAVVAIFSSIWNGIVNIFQIVTETLRGILDTVCSWFGTTWDSTWSAISAFFMGIWNGIVSWFSTTLTNIQTTFTTVWTAVSTFFSNTWNTISTTVSTVLNTISTTISTVWNGIKTTISTVVISIQTTIATIFTGISNALSIVFNSIKSTATTIWNAIQSAIESPINAASTTIARVVSGISTALSTVFNSIKSTATTIWNSIKSAITSPIETAKTTVKNLIDEILGFFDFEWSLPKLKMPHLTISGSFSLSPPSVPTFSIDWYKKAMNGGMILDTATIFGFNSKTGKFLAGGEAGSETVVGTKSLLNMIKQAVYEAVGPLVLASHELATASAELGYVTYNGFTKLKESKEMQYRANQNNNGGDTYIFHSPKAIDEIEAAKQMKRTKRELAEGF